MALGNLGRVDSLIQVTGQRTWLSIRVDLVAGHGEHFWPRPGRIFAAARSHTFTQLAAAIDDGRIYRRSNEQVERGRVEPLRGPSWAWVEPFSWLAS